MQTSCKGFINKKNVRVKHAKIDFKTLSKVRKAKVQHYDRFVSNKTKASERESLLKAFIRTMLLELKVFLTTRINDHLPCSLPSAIFRSQKSSSI